MKPEMTIKMQKLRNQSLLLINTLLCLSAPSAFSADLIITNARIIDGTGAPWFRGSVSITNGKIEKVGELSKDTTAPLVIDAKDKYISPGFIDVHTHSEDDLFKLPEAENFIRMGVTTLILGNCGSSYLDLNTAYTSHTQIGMSPNIASLFGHNTVRRAIMGNVNRDPSTTETAEMKRLVTKSMKDGALGLSTGLIYTPGLYAKTPEIIDLMKSASEYKGIYVSHMRSEGLNVKDAIREALKIGKEANSPVHISHFKITSPKLYGQSSTTLQMVEDARRNGQDVTIDQYAYAASSTTIRSMLPDEAAVGTSDEVKNRLLNPTLRKKIIQEMINSYTKSGRKNLSHAYVTNFSADRSINGMNIPAIAKKWKNADDWDAQITTVLDIITSGGSGMVFHSMDENDVQNIMKYHSTMFGSDSGVRQFGAGVPHPRGYGNNARILSRYARDLKLFTIEEAIRRMTSLPARTMHLFDRGLIRPNMAADIILFDIDKVFDPATFEAPHAYAEGFEYVIVNGVPVLDNKSITKKYPGKVLYGPGYDPK